MRTIHGFMAVVILVLGSTAFGDNGFKTAINAGRAKMKARDYVGAMADYSNALKQAASDTDKQTGGNYLKTARACYGRQLLATEGHPYFQSKQLFTEGYGCYLDREFVKARDVFAKVAALKDGYPDTRANAQFLIGYMSYVTQNYAQARQELEKVQAIPDASGFYTAEALVYIGQCRLAEKNDKAARDAFAKAAALEGKDKRTKTAQTEAARKLEQIRKRTAK